MEGNETFESVTKSNKGKPNIAALATILTVAFMMFFATSGSVYASSGVVETPTLESANLGKSEYATGEAITVTLEFNNPIQNNSSYSVIKIEIVSKYFTGIITHFGFIIAVLNKVPTNGLRNKQR